MAIVRKQILMVEDDDGIRRELKGWLLEKNQHWVEVAHSTEAPERLADLSFALLVCDASVLGKLPIPPGTAVILTSPDQTVFTRRDLGLGCYGFLVAPFSVDELTASIRDASRRRALALEHHNRAQELQDIRGILRNVQEVVYRVDSVSGEFSYISPSFERMFGFSTDEIRDMGGRRAFLALVIQEHQFDQQERILGDIRSAQPVVLTGTAVAAWRCKDGSLKWIEDHWFPVYKNDQLISTDGILYDITERKAAQEALVLANNQLKTRTTELEENKQALEMEAAARKRMELEIEKTHKKLLSASRQAGMAEIATNVLHNVGNVLNSVNVSASSIAEQVRHTKGASVAKLAALFDQHKADLAGFLTKDSKGQQIPHYLNTLAEALAAEQATQITEVENLLKNIEHIKSIVAMQQSYAQAIAVIEAMPVTDIIEDALRINADSLIRHDVEALRDYQVRSIIHTDKHKVMQILINLVRNAKHACDDSGRDDKQIIVRTTGDDRTVMIAIIDNGIGIPPENLTRIFNHGFTTRKEGHGFGLHSSALAAKELGGALTGQSDGPGRGATFVLELPIQPSTSSHETTIRG